MAVGREKLDKPPWLLEPILEGLEFSKSKTSEQSRPHGLHHHEMRFACGLPTPAQMPIWQHEASFQPLSPEVVHTLPVLYGTDL